MNLLTKTRTLNRLLQKAAGNAVNFMEMAEVLKDIIAADVYVISRKGKILGHAAMNPLEESAIQRMVRKGQKIPVSMNDKLKKFSETTSNEDPGYEQFELIASIAAQLEQQFLTVIPVTGGGERIGTLLIARQQARFNDDDLILAEYGATIVGMELIRVRTEEVEAENRSRAIVQIAVASLSYSETGAVEHIYEELNGQREGLLIASKIADRAGITRSVIVNALRKLESAGVIETKSLGRKGTYIKILNDQLTAGFDKVRAE